MSDTASNMTHLAIGVVGQNIVIDCGSHDEAVRLVETVRVGKRLAVGVVGQNIVIDCGSHDEAMRLVETVSVGEDR